MWQEKIDHFSKIVFETKDRALAKTKIGGSWEGLLAFAKTNEIKTEIITAYKQSIYAVLLQTCLRYGDDVASALKNESFLSEMAEVFFNKKAEMYGSYPTWDRDQSAHKAYIEAIKALLLEIEKENIKLTELLSSGEK